MPRSSRGTALAALDTSQATALTDVPTTLASGELTDGQVGGYFVVLLSIIGTLVFFSVRDLTRSNEYQTKRQAFIDSIEGEIAELESQGDEAALQIAAELEEKLGKLRVEVMNEQKERLEARWLGAGRFFMPLEFQDMPAASKDARITPAEFTKSDISSPAEYADKKLQDVDDLIGNRYERRLQKKRRKRKASS